MTINQLSRQCLYTCLRWRSTTSSLRTNATFAGLHVSTTSCSKLNLCTQSLKPPTYFASPPSTALLSSRGHLLWRGFTFAKEPWSSRCGRGKCNVNVKALSGGGRFGSRSMDFFHRNSARFLASESYQLHLLQRRLLVESFRLCTEHQQSDIVWTMKLQLLPRHQLEISHLSSQHLRYDTESMQASKRSIYQDIIHRRPLLQLHATSRLIARPVR